MNFDFFLNFLERHGRKRTILDRESREPYLNRYYLFLKDRKKFPFNIFLHQFLRSDPDDLHDHPWPYATLIIKGGYWEWVPVFEEEYEYYSICVPDSTMIYEEKRPVNKTITGERRIWRGPGHFRICNPKSYHRIELEPGKDCWTVFMPGPQKREWGFLTHKDWKKETFKWVQHEQYISDKLSNERR